MDHQIDIEALDVSTCPRQALLELDDMRHQAGATVELDQSRTGRLSRMDALLQVMVQAGKQRAALI